MEVAASSVSSLLFGSCHKYAFSLRKSDPLKRLPVSLHDYVRN